MKQQACPACGTSIEPGARFCYACGTPISSSAIVQTDRRRRWLWLLWPLVLVGLVALILWHRAAVYDRYVEGSCAITASGFETRAYLSYTVQSATGQRAEATRNYPYAYLHKYSVGTSYPCWYNPADLTSADLDHYSGPFDTFSTDLMHGNLFVGNNNFLVWSMLLGFAYLFFVPFWNHLFSVIQCRRHMLSTEATVLSVDIERRHSGERRTRLVDIAFVTFTAQDGASYCVKIDETLQPSDVVPLWYDATNPTESACREVPPWSWAIWIACISLLFLAGIVYLLYIGWTAF